ncbi:MAG: complex I NDUFA9 subunit family protein [Burkholderiales bacterium]
MRVLVVGGTGFIGRQVVGRLAAQGHDVRVPTRRAVRARELQVYPAVQIIECDIHDEPALAQAIDGCGAVINLVGILHSAGGEPWGQDFDRAHVQLPARIAAACRARGVRRLIHMSALGADIRGPSAYLRSKAAGEQRILDAFAGWDEGAVTIFRASVVFGPQDSFMNMFARLARMFPVLPIAGARARMQPVYVGDVAGAMVSALGNPATIGQVYDLAGPTVYSLGELVRLAAAWSGHPRPVVEMPMTLGRLQAMLFECLPGEPLLSRDNLDSLSVDNISDAPMDPVLGVVPTPLESIAPGYLGSRDGKG